MYRKERACQYSSWIWACCFLITLFITAPALSKEARPEVGVRALGMAGAFTSGADDPTAALWNPAGLAKVQRKGIVVYDLSQGAISFAYPISHIGTLGLSVLDLNYNDRFVVDNIYNPIGKFEVGYNQITLSYARSIDSHLMIGANFGYNKAPWEGCKWQPSFDAGVVTQVKPDIFLGANITDIAGTKFYNSDGEILQNFYQQVSIGASWTPRKYFHLSSDFNTAKWKIRLGAEKGFKEIYLRSGVIVNLKNEETSFGWTAGLSINTGNTQLNYAYLNDHDVDYKHLLSAGFAFGGPRTKQPDEPRPVAQKPKHNSNKIVRKTPTSQKIPPKSKNSPVQNTGDSQPVSEPKNTQPIVIDKDIPHVEKSEGKQSKATTKNTPASAPQRNSEFGIRNSEFKNKSEIRTPKSEPWVIRLTKKHNVELPLILAVIEIESRFQADIVSGVGAVGFMQLMPDTARDMGLKVPQYKNILKPKRNPRLDERFDPRKNVEAGVRYLRRMIDRYNNYVLALCAYNAGPGRVVDKNVPKIRETERHVGKVLNRYYEYKNSPEELQIGLEKLNRILGE